MTSGNAPSQFVIPTEGLVCPDQAELRLSPNGLQLLLTVREPNGREVRMLFPWIAAEELGRRLAQMLRLDRPVQDQRQSPN